MKKISTYLVYIVCILFSGMVYPQETFGPQQIINSVALDAVSIDIADLDGDGDFDVLGAYSNIIDWYEHDGTGSFIAQFNITFIGNNPSSIRAVDLDSDGDMDVLAASISDNKIAWYENDGAGNF